MPPSAQHSPNVWNMDASEGQQILLAVRSLRRTIIDSWQARSVILSREERSALREEIRDTCALLTDLTAGE